VISWNHCKELRLSEARMNHTYYTHWWIATCHFSVLVLECTWVGPQKKNLGDWKNGCYC
jgi:hypothetical protein